MQRALVREQGPHRSKNRLTQRRRPAQSPTSHRLGTAAAQEGGSCCPSPAAGPATAHHATPSAGFTLSVFPWPVPLLPRMRQRGRGPASLAPPPPSPSFSILLQRARRAKVQPRACCLL
ncbi:unnamed protein product [Prorocentrum cordatum]|uniref:Uncharacterized protein n=1 Tax=Prorocentrum cordatum TaxID=2364126 RepID=A0ABN9WC14_9DINO|nr:unnamed protein product [Polarella glacialis]